MGNTDKALLVIAASLATIAESQAGKAKQKKDSAKIAEEIRALTLAALAPAPQFDLSILTEEEKAAMQSETVRSALEKIGNFDS